MFFRFSLRIRRMQAIKNNGTKRQRYIELRNENGELRENDDANGCAKMGRIRPWIQFSLLLLLLLLFCTAGMIWRVTRVTLTMENPFFSFFSTLFGLKKFYHLLKCALFFRLLIHFSTDTNFNLVLCNCPAGPFPSSPHFSAVSGWASTLTHVHCHSTDHFFTEHFGRWNEHTDEINPTTVGCFFLFNLSIDNEQFPWDWNCVDIGLVATSLQINLYAWNVCAYVLGQNGMDFC